jgi:predicted RNase H-like nuclease
VIVRVLGVDACKRGWVGVLVTDGAVDGTLAAPTLAHLLDSAGRVDVVGIDMPIGTPSGGVRRADIEARREVGPHVNSVFLTPSREVLNCATYGEALARSVALTGRGISQQAYALRGKLFEVDEVVAGRDDVCEIHPEVSFRWMAGAHLRYAKTTWAGVDLRLRLLADQGLTLAGPLEPAGGYAAPDDLLDAAAGAWSAARVHRGDAVSLPSPPEIIQGRPVAIWA